MSQRLAGTGQIKLSGVANQSDLTATAMTLNPFHGQTRSILLRIGINMFSIFNCMRENLVRLSTFPFSHQPGTENLLKSKMVSTRKFAFVNAVASFSELYRSRCCKTSSRVPYKA